MGTSYSIYRFAKPTKLELSGIPGLQEYRFVPVSNNVLAKAEIPFLYLKEIRGSVLLRRIDFIPHLLCGI